MVVSMLIGILSSGISAQEAQSKEGPGKDAQPIAPRATPGDYQTHTEVGPITIAAEFTGHSAPTPEAVYTTEDYVIVEIAFFGPADAKLKLAYQDFSLRVNGKKAPLAAVPYEFVAKSLKDPEWVPPDTGESKSKSSFGTGGQSGDPKPLPPKMPFELQRTMQLRVKKAALIDGERPVPVAGLIFFEHRGKVESLRSIELMYAGAAGKATLTLQ